MKIQYIFLLAAGCFNCACYTSSSIKAPQHLNSYSRIHLANVEFSDGTIFISDGVEGHSYRDKFGDTSYQKLVYVHYSEPYHTYLMESGGYELNQLSLTFKPRTKMQCRIENIVKFMDCGSNGDFSNGFYVNFDTLDEIKFKELGFQPRTTEITFEDKKMMFNDPAMPRYVQFQQIIR